MRIYPGHYIPRLECIARYVTVTLDGSNVERALWADEDAGSVCVYKIDNRGAFYLRGGEIASEVLHGDVVIHAPTWERSQTQSRG